MTSEADCIFQQAFQGTTRTPRSAAYQRGVRAALAYRCERRPIVLPYRAGTAEADAFWAGLGEGHALWRERQPAVALGQGLPHAGRPT
jgi:hypothetical protein